MYYQPLPDTNSMQKKNSCETESNSAINELELCSCVHKIPPLKPNNASFSRKEGPGG
jgi:hypothetical protein